MTTLNSYTPALVVGAHSYSTFLEVEPRLCILPPPQTTACSSGAGVAAPSRYVSQSVERAARAPRRVRGSVCAQLFPPPSRPACLLMIAAATSSRLTPTCPISTPTSPNVDQHTSPTTRSALSRCARTYTVGGPSYRCSASGGYAVATESMSVAAFSDEPATRGPLPGEKGALDWSAQAACICTRARSRCTRSAQRGLWGAREWLAGGAPGAAHRKHVDHVQDAGGVKAQGLVEGQRVLPRVASRAHGAERAAGREAGGGKRARLARSGQGRGLDCADIRGEARGEQPTRNM